MEEVTLVADAPRATGKAAARQVRREGKVPAIVYGLTGEPEAIAVPAREFAHILAGPGGANTLINLDLNGRQELVLARQVVKHPVRLTFTHVDFIRVSRDTAVSADIPIHLVGEAAGVRDGGLVEQILHSLAIEAKPADLPPGVEVDVSALLIGDHLSVSDIVLPPGVTLMADPDAQVVHVSQPRGIELPEDEVAAEAEGEEGEGGGEAAAGESPEGE
jgi:large subunit ribosomal protein L25